MDFVNEIIISLLVWIVVHTLVFFHTTNSVINFIEWPNIKINFSTLESSLVIKQVHAYATNCPFFTWLLKTQNDICTQSCLYWKHAVSQVAKVFPFIYTDVIAEIYLFDDSLIYQFFTAMI